ncbi:MAG: hypothetical protein ACREDU_11755, partial [Methylocella sp.]
MFTLARKAELLGDQIVLRDGQAVLRKHHYADTENAMAFMEAKGILTPQERHAGDMLASMRRKLFGTGVVPNASFYQQMTAPAKP